MTKAVAYYRVSTTKQGVDGYGMDAQHSAVHSFLNTGRWELIGEFKEVESGTRNDRPELARAIALCRRTKATLIIAKIDRLARNVTFILNLRDSGVNFVACDMPHASKMTITILAAVAEQERDWIAERTRAGMAEARARGVTLGNPRLAAARRVAGETMRHKSHDFARLLAPVIADIRRAGVHHMEGIAEALNRLGWKTARGMAFTRQTVQSIQRRLRE